MFLSARDALPRSRSSSVRDSQGYASREKYLKYTRTPALNEFVCEGRFIIAETRRAAQRGLFLQRATFVLRTSERPAIIIGKKAR